MDFISNEVLNELNAFLLVYRSKICKALSSRLNEDLQQILNQVITEVTATSTGTSVTYFIAVNFTTKLQKVISAFIIILATEDNSILSDTIENFGTYLLVRNNEWKKAAESSTLLQKIATAVNKAVIPMGALVAGKNGILLDPILSANRESLDIESLNRIYGYVLGRLHGPKQDETLNAERYVPYFEKVATLVDEKRLQQWRELLLSDDQISTIHGNFKPTTIQVTEQILVIGDSLVDNALRMEDIGALGAHLTIDYVRNLLKETPDLPSRNIIRKAARNLVSRTIPTILANYYLTTQLKYDKAKEHLIDFFLAYFLVFESQQISDERITNILSTMALIFAQEAPCTAFMREITLPTE